MLDEALEDGREFLVGDRFTVADLCVTYALFNASEHGLCGEGFAALGQSPLSERYRPATSEYLGRMMARPGWQAAMSAQASEGSGGGGR